MTYETLVVNFYGGPGTGKSTTAALTFGKLKQRDVSAELVTEFAKDLVWEGRSTIECQPYIFGKQLWRLERLLGQVEVVVTDSPLLLCAIYGENLGKPWREVIRGRYDTMRNLDVFLRRDEAHHPYRAEGRYQATVAEAALNDEKILDLLIEEQISYTSMEMGPLSAEIVTSLVERSLNR